MNKNDKKTSRPAKGYVDPKSITEYKVYRETTLMDFLLFKMGQGSRKTVKHLLSNHQVSVGGAPVSQFDYPLFPEDVVIVSKNRIAKHESRDLPILYEDEDIIAIDKPSGLLSVASDREKGHTAYRLVTDYLSAKKKNGRAFVVHRLDEDTSGVLIFAKSNEVREALQKKWQEVVSKRYYYAIVEGTMEKKEDVLRDYLTQNDLHLVYITKDKINGKLAVTAYKTIEEKGSYSLLDIALSSGRKNQIRVQLGERGHHIIGDDKYGEPANPLNRLGLHAYELAFVNPLSGKSYDIKSPMPKEFKAIFFEKSAAKQAEKAMEKTQRKSVRNTRSQTKIEKGKSRRQSMAARYGKAKPQASKKRGR